MENKSTLYYRVMRAGGCLPLIFTGLILVKIKTEMLLTSLFINHRYKAHRRSSPGGKCTEIKNQRDLRNQIFNKFVLILVGQFW